MNVVLWILQGLLAAAFLFSGARKLSQTREQALAEGAYVKLYPEWTRRMIAILEIAAAVGLVLPAVTGIAPVLLPIAAAGLVLLMAGAAATHLRIGGDDRRIVPVNLVLLALAAVVAWGRFGPYSI
jgi:DoxX-like family